MNRRDFVKSGLISLAAVNTLDPSAFSGVQTQGAYSEGQKIVLSNKYLDWEMTMAGGAVRSTSLHNKLSDRVFALSGSREIVNLRSLKPKRGWKSPGGMSRSGPTRTTLLPTKSEATLVVIIWRNTARMLTGGRPRIYCCACAVWGRAIFPQFSEVMRGFANSSSCRERPRGNRSPSAWGAIRRKTGMHTGSTLTAQRLASERGPAAGASPSNSRSVPVHQATSN